MKNHLLIAGTGRAGTTFLVEYLAACGLDTQLARKGRHAYDDAANAGLEDLLIGEPDAPYVCKSPWLYEFVERLLADGEVIIDAVIVPMRSLVEASTSRVVNEMRARYATTAMPDDCKQWASWGSTPGGVVYSLNPIDQARLLALGFHELLHVLIRRNIPVVLLDFPRFVEDHDYLYESLDSVLGHRVDRVSAQRAHERLAMPAKVRVGRELAADGDVKKHLARPGGPQRVEFPSHEALDRIALVRELAATRVTLDKMKARVAHADAIEASTSWRITAPLRALSGRLRRWTAR
ncbi:hypothetical protein VAR608DRAFT_3505 [Variovorax sp. HW608]|uniref:hypothetical protein n=1 Tax=Variovorax sp. HW608 TaxID=1034889 RepID=UPI00081FD1C1|nr:hypothetical protein [Variovorax sp. HW608]SCK37876.1 hypothetical protein VAR608DRAFT_3505 [Variovorax sp. HW608]